MWLDKKRFEAVVELTPLISIDLIVRDRLGRVLLGRRSNRPAKGYWFVPGGRIQKDETIGCAFLRLAVNELGVELDVSLGQFLGVYQHFYDDNVFNRAASTHYVVLGFELVLDEFEFSALPNEQHDSYRWFSVAEILAESSVHSNSKDYFRKSTNFK